MYPGNLLPRRGNENISVYIRLQKNKIGSSSKGE